jgi:general secretion pathway protein D
VSFSKFFKLLLLGIICSGFLAQAQEDAEAPQTPPQSQQANISNPQDPLIPLVLPNNPLNEVLATYERLTGKRLIKDIQSLANSPQNNFSIVVPGEIPRSEAIRLIETLLLLNNIYLVPGPDNSVKVMGVMKNPRQENVPLHTSVDTLPKSDQIVSFFMPLRYISSQDAVTALSQASPSHQPYGLITPIPNSQSLVITESSSAIRRLVALKELIDVPPAERVSEFVQLERADAENVSKLLTDAIKANKGNNNNAATNIPGQPPQPSPEGEVPVPSATPQVEKGAISGDVQLIPDPRTNRILVITQKSNFESIKKLINEFDKAVDLAQPLEFPLKYISASEVLPVLQTILTEGKEGGSQNAAGGASTTSPNSAAQPVSSSTSGTDSGVDQMASLQAPTQDTLKSIIVGKTQIVADPKANAIIVFGPPENRQKIRTVLTKLDKRPLQVYLSTVIGQLTLGDGLEFGVDLFQKYGRIDPQGTFGAAAGLKTRTGTGDTTPDPTSLVSTAALTAATPAGLTVYGVLNNSLNAYIKALQSSNRFKILSRPTVFTGNNKLAVISSGSEVPVPDSILSQNNLSSSNNVAQSSTIQFKKVVLKLQVVPLINPDKEVTLTIGQQNDSVTGSTTITGITVPTIGTQQITTTVTLHNRETAIIGGLITESDQTTTTGLPFLSKIPILGYLFKDTQKTKQRQELVILIQPTVIETTADLMAVQEEENTRAEVGNETFQMAEPHIVTAPPQTTLRMRYPEVRIESAEPVPEAVVAPQ